MRVMIITEDQRFAQALRFLLHRQPGVLTVEQSAFQAGLAQHIERAQPDVILVDSDSSTTLPTAVSGVSNLWPHDCRVIVLSSKFGAEQLAMAMGADDFVTKSKPPGQLLGLLREVEGALRQDR